MNTYSKFCANVFLAKCTEQHEKGSTIIVETKYGKENECIVFNLVYQKDGFYFYSIVRADGFNQQEFAKRRAEKLMGTAARLEDQSNKSWEASKEGKDFLVLAEPIKVGHHSEKRHRALIERNHKRMNKAIELQKQASTYENRAAYWEEKANTINLSMPESIEFYEYKFETAKLKHEEMKKDASKRAHAYSLTYAKKEVNEALKNLEIAQRLWA